MSLANVLHKIWILSGTIDAYSVNSARLVYLAKSTSFDSNNRIILVLKVQLFLWEYYFTACAL